jgi:hypothetical protein
VTGAKAIDAAWLAAELKETTERPSNRSTDTDEDAPHWPIGKPAWFDSVSLDWLHKRVAELVNERYPSCPHFTVKAVPEVENGVAVLVIEFSNDEGPVTIGEIEVEGNSRNSREDLLAFLEVRPGMLLTHEVMDRIDDRLANCGRFISSSCTVEPPAENSASTTLLISVTEYDQAPASRPAPLARGSGARPFQSMGAAL